jgi:nucleoside-diphosphate-sugar epimerase
MSKVLVTGGGGFLGRAIVSQLLQRGDTVTVFSRRRFPDLEELGVESIPGDLGDPKAVANACKGKAVVYHVAALAGAWGSSAVFERTNVLGTQHVISGCRAASVPKLVFTSSPSVVSPSGFVHHEGVDESEPYPEDYLADYPRTKAASEQAVLAANGDGLLTCALRPHLIVGPGDTHLLPRVFRMARAGRLRVIGDGKNKVDLTWIDDAARAHLQAADALKAGAPVAGKVYFITQDDPVELWPWINALLEAVGMDPIRKSISFRGAFRLGSALETTWRWLRLSGEPPMTRFVAIQLGTSHWFDCSAARRDFGYTPSRPMAEVTKLLHATYSEGEGRLKAGIA